MMNRENSRSANLFLGTYFFSHFILKGKLQKPNWNSKLSIYLWWMKEKKFDKLEMLPKDTDAHNQNT